MQSSVVTRRNDPNYSQFSVYIPRVLVKRVKSAALEKDTNLTEIAEQALELWLASNLEEPNNPKQ